MESPNLWAVLIISFITHKNNNINMSTISFDNKSNWSNMILLFYFVLHYVNRSIIFPLAMRKTNDMPISVMLLAFLYCTWNGLTQAIALVVVIDYDEQWIYDPRFIIGSIIFFTGLYVNISSDRILIALRSGANSNNNNNNKEKKYSIPRGGLFEYVSCANYSGEMFEWIGFAIG